METLEEAKAAPETQRLAFLLQSWNLKAPTVIGRMCHWKDELWTVRDVRTIQGQELEYPFASDLARTRFGRASLLDEQGIFVGRCSDDLKDRYVEVRFAISSRQEQEKWGNPFKLQAVRGGITPLAAVPESAFVRSPDGGILLAETVARSVVDSVAETIDRELIGKRNQFDEEVGKLQHELAAKRQQWDGEIARATARLGESSRAAAEAEETLASLQRREEAVRATVAQLEQECTDKMNQLNELRSFVGSRASWLRDFGLISTADHDRILGIEPIRPAVEPLLSLMGDIGGNLRDAVSCMQTYFAARDLLFPRYLLEDFLTLLRADDLVILAGAPGSGKTQLVRSFADALGGVARIIPVKPNWTSSDDLIGYYNPLQREFVETEFLKALREAADNPAAIHIICLDEMNLARIEHYFADFLSKLEDRVGERTIDLYPSAIWEADRAEFEQFCSIIERITDGVISARSILDVLADPEANAKLQALLGTRDEDEVRSLHARMRRLVTCALNLPPRITVPPNVRFVGTVNIDDTTHHLSPKLLDRVQVLRFPNSLEYSWDDVWTEIKNSALADEIRSRIEQCASTARPLFSDVRAVFPDRVPYPPFDHSDPLAETLISWDKNYFSPLGLDTSLRAVRQSLHYRNLLRDLLSDSTPSLDEALALNYFVLHKVLPRFSFRGDEPVEDFKLISNNEVQEKRECVAVFQDELGKALTRSLKNTRVPTAVAAVERLSARAEARGSEYNYWH